MRRFALFLTWTSSDRISRALESDGLAFLGFLFLPFTTFFCVAAWAPMAHVQGLGVLLVIFGFMLDLASYRAGARTNRQRPQWSPLIFLD